MKPKDYKVALREKAVSLLEKMPENLDELDKETVKNLFHELQVHQIELEIQNEELRNIQNTLEANRIKYTSLFDNAPVGYVILDQSGIIKQFNKTFAQMIQAAGISKKRLSFADLMAPASAAAFRARYKAFFKNPAGKRMEADLLPGKAAVLNVLIEASTHGNSLNAIGNQPKELLITVTDITEIKQTKQALQESLEASKKKENEIRAFLECARMILEQTDFETTARKVFQICSRIIGSTSGFAALMQEEEPGPGMVFIKDGDLPFPVEPDLPEALWDLRKTAFDGNTTAYQNRWVDPMDGPNSSPISATLDNLMFTPLQVKQKTVGLIGLANKEAGFNDNDANLAKGFGELAAIAFQNSRNLDIRTLTEKENEKLIEDLTEALANIKQLSGLVPICSHCKKIRDDKGFWNNLEAYIEHHSEAKFTHGMCPDCTDEFYGDDPWYLEMKANKSDDGE